MTIQQAEAAMTQAVRETPEYQEFTAARDAAFADHISGELLKEYARLQNKLQMFAVTGRQPEENETERFRQLGGLLFATPVTARYLMAQIKMQKMMADIFGHLSEGAGIAIELPDLS